MSFLRFSRTINRKGDQYVRFVRVRAYDKRVDLDLGRYAQGPEHVQYVRLSPGQARAVARALLRAADELVRKPRRVM